MSDFKAFCNEYAIILDKFNRIHSLSRYSGAELIAQINDSIAPLELFDELKNAKIAIDVGSGAGLPGLFLAAKMRQCEWHLFEPIAKKSSFLSYCVAHLEIKNATIHSKKIEKSDKFKADIITSRALSKASELINLCAGFYDNNSHFLLYKGSEYQSELKELKERFKTANITSKNGQNSRIYALIRKDT